MTRSVSASSRTQTKGDRKIHKVMKEYKSGELKSGNSGRRVTSRKQAVAIALSEARRAGARIAPKKEKTG